MREIDTDAISAKLMLVGVLLALSPVIVAPPLAGLGLIAHSPDVPTWAAAMMLGGFACLLVSFALLIFSDF